MTLDKALQRIAAIHQQHSIKCYLSTQYLSKKLNLCASDIAQLDVLLDSEEPVFESEILTSEVLPFNPVIKRRHWVLSHGLYPYSYFTMAQWFQETDFSIIVDHYLDLGIKHKQYLNHNISILLAFKESFEQITTRGQKLKFIERFTEFVTTTFYQDAASNDSKIQVFDPKNIITLDQVFDSSLNRPGFWGHNLISFSWILRHKNSLTSDQFNPLLANVYDQCHWLFDDAEDKPIIDTLYQGELSTAALHTHCRYLLFNSYDNLHQITLAASVAYLYELDWITPDHKRQLLSILMYYSQQASKS